MSMQVGPGISINIHVTSDTDGLAKREYVDQKLEEAERGEIKTVNGAGPDESGDVKVNGLPEGAGTHQQLVTDANGVAKWENKPFYDESDILYNGYPEYAFGYAKLSFVLKEDVKYKLRYINDEGNAAGSAMPYVATKNTYGIIGFSDDDETHGFRLEYSESDGDCYFYPDGTVFKDGEPETSDDGTYAYTSKVMLVIGYADDADVGVVPLPERYVPSAVPVIQSATVGQTIVVKAVDEDGKPTEWEAADAVTKENINTISFAVAQDPDGNIATAFVLENTLPDSAFRGLEIEKVALPQGLEIIGEKAFNECSNLVLTKLPDGVTRIGSSAFRYCSNLALTSLPDGLVEIGQKAFMYCLNLALTSLPEGLTFIGDEAFYSCRNLALTSLPKSIAEIRTDCFASCDHLALKSLPKGITTIGEYAFNNCPEVAITIIPAAVSTIATGAFRYCTGITELTFHGTPSTIGSDAIKCSNLLTINVPWGEGDVAGAPWGATNATINYRYGMDASYDWIFGEIVTFDTIDTENSVASATFASNLTVEATAEESTSYTVWLDGVPYLGTASVDGDGVLVLAVSGDDFELEIWPETKGINYVLDESASRELSEFDLRIQITSKDVLYNE